MKDQLTFNFIGNIQTTQFLDYSYLDFVWTYYVVHS